MFLTYLCTYHTSPHMHATQVLINNCTQRTDRRRRLLHSGGLLRGLRLRDVVRLGVRQVLQADVDGQGAERAGHGRRERAEHHGDGDEPVPVLGEREVVSSEVW